MKEKTKIAAAQLSPVFLNKEKTVEKACKAIQEAGENGAKVINKLYFSIKCQSF